MSVSLSLKNICRRFIKDNEEFLAVNNVNLDVQPGEFLTFLGPSGCGKTTTLRMISGFEYPTSGNVFIGDRDVAKIPPNKRGISMVFQSYALFPHLNIWENIAYGLRVAKIPQDEIIRRTNDVVELMQLKGMEKRFPNQLSGGQQQRVAIARALALHPDILCFDEPTSALDPELTGEVLKVIRGLAEQKTTMIIVTHDLSEAISLADKVYVLSARPATIKTVLPIQLTLQDSSPLAARNAPEFPYYFKQLWEELTDET